MNQIKFIESHKHNIKLEIWSQGVQHHVQCRQFGYICAWEKRENTRRQMSNLNQMRRLVEKQREKVGKER